MEHSSIEVVLRSQEEDVRELNMSHLLKRVRKLKGGLALLLIVSLLAGVVVGAVRGCMEGMGSVTAMVSFAFQGIENGEDPNGAVFDINKMKAPAILRDALDETAITTIEVETLRNALTFEGVVPQDVQERIATLQTVGEKTPSALEQILEVSYHPSQYMITLNIRALKLSDAQGKALLTAIMDQYRTWFFETYGGATSLGEAMTALDLTSYDYVEAVDIVETQTMTISNYLESLQARAPSFRSANTGFTFADLRNQLSILSNVDSAKLNSIILSTGLTKDRAALEGYYSYQIQMASTQLVSIQEQQRGIETAIASYEKDSIVLMSTGEGTVPTTMTQTSDEYDRLFQERTSLSKQAAQQQQRLTIIQQRLDSLSNKDAVTGAEGTDGTAATTPDYSVEESKVKVEKSLPELSQKLASIIEAVNATADEYYETVAFKTAYQISLPAQTFYGGIVGIAKEVIVFTAIFAVVAIFIALGVVVLPPLFTGKLFKKASLAQKHVEEEEEEELREKVAKK